MARRSNATNLIGLAGLATLGYQLMKGRNKKNVPVEDLAAEAGPDYGEDYARELARAGRGQVGVGEVKPKAVSTRVENPKNTAAETPAAKQERTGGRGTGDAQLSDYIMRRERDKEAGMSRGTRPADPRDLELGMSRGRREPGPPKVTTSAPGRAPTREELIAQIPGGDARPGVLTTPANPVTGNEFTRNLSNTAMALGASRLPGAVAAGTAEKMAMIRASRLANARRTAEGFSPEEAMAARAAMERSAARNALSEADTTGGAIGFKKGGSTRKAVPAKKAAYAKGGAVKKETKPAAKGWGMARGGRAAKIY